MSYFNRSVVKNIFITGAYAAVLLAESGELLSASNNYVHKEKKEHSPHLEMPEHIPEKASGFELCIGNSCKVSYTLNSKNPKLATAIA